MDRNPANQHHESRKKILDAPMDQRTRIETQIHRRSKAKAVLPLEAEWQVGADHPSSLRLPAKLMVKQRNDGK